MVNNSRADWMFLGVADDLTANTTNPIHPVTLTPSATKAVTTTGPYIPTSAVTYKLTFGVSSSSPATLMANPVVVDLLPLNVNYVSYLYNASGSGLPAPTLEQVADFGGTGRTLLRWRFTGTMNRGKKAFITVNTTLAAGTPEGSLSNTFGVTVDNMPMNGGTADTQDLDGDGQTTDKLITATTSIAIAQLIGLDSQKRVKGELDASYSVYPSYGHTVPNGLVSYRLSIINRGNILINNVRVVDILPFVGDTGVQDTRARGSLWRPILVSPIPAQAGVSIYYSISSNPCRPEIVSTGPAGCTAANWSLTPPSKLDTVRSIRFDFSGTMSPGKVFTFEWTMRAPASGADESVAWNSFAFTSTNALTGVPLRPAEPNKVGIMLDTTPLPSLITIKKYTNTFDADDFPGPYIPLTDTVTWTYDVTNMGQTRLANIVVTDDVEGTITCPATALNPGEEMTCTLVSLDLPQLGQYTNVASVTSVAVDASDVPLDFDPVAPGTQLIQPTAYDPSHYYGYDPGTARLGDYAWIDLDYNGVQDAGEPPLGGVTVRLLNEAGNPVDEPAKAGTQDYVTTTDGSGFYAFVNLPAGTYQVQFDLPSAYSVTQANATDDALDSDLDPATNRTGLYTLAVDENNQTVDAGFIARATLGDQLWMDANGSGIQDSSEMTAPALLLGLQVDLMDATGTTTVATTYTDSAGNYIFNDLFPGSYVVRFPAPPTGYLWTTPYAGSADADSDANVVTNLSGVITLQAGEINSSVDAGLVAPASIGDQVWADNNLNGVQDNSESGVAGVTVRLLNSGGTQATDDTGALIPDTTTDATGVYTFANLRSGQYEVRFTLPAGYIFTTLDAAIDTVDSDAIVSGANIGRTVLTTLSAAEADTSWDAGLVKLASIGDLVWRDANNNGQQDVGESGVNGVTVTLLDSTGTPVTSDALGNAIAPITTPASGAYSFDNLDPRQTYIVQFERLTTDVFATANSGADATDSDAVPSGTLPAGIGRSGTITLTAGAADTSVDAGMVVAAAIGNAVFYDNDNSGTQTAGDTPVPAVTVRLLDSAGVQSLDERGNVIPDQTTDVNGLYHFTGLLPGTYGLAFFTLPTDYTFAQIDVGADDAVDSDPNRFTGLTPTTLLDVGEDDTTWDAGLVQAAALGDLVWVDVNANGQQDAGETGLSGVTVNLLDGTGAAVDNPNTPAVDSYSMTTDSNGNYLFDGLPPNLTYRVQFIRSGNYVFAPANSGADATDSDGQLSGQTTVASVMTVDITTLIPNASDLTWDQGMLLPSGLGNFVWRDGNDDGLQTAAEPGISGATVNLLDSTGTPVDDPNTTGTQNYTLDSNAAGGYLFTNLYPGTYILEFITPTGCKRADYLVGAGANAATDSDMQISGADAGRTPAITLAYDSTDLTWDAGFVPLATLGDFVWRDNNDNGVQDAGEPGISGATVNLLDSTGTTVTTDGMGNAINPVTTPASGAYTFTDLDPDLDYIVQFTLPTPATGVAGYTFSPQNAGADTADSDADFVTGRTAVIALNPGQTDNTQDAGMTPLAQIGDYVWNDLNGDGAQGGAGETGVDGVVVKLYLASDLTTALYTTTTAANPVGGAAGYYQFLNLDAGTYVVEFTLPNDYIFTRQDAATATDTTDSDANRFSGQTGSYTLTWGETNQTADAGIVQPASLGDFVWYDTNDNGLQDVGESGQNGIVVRLLDTTNAAVDNPNTVAVNDAYVVTTANDPISGLPGYYVFSDLIPGDYRVQFDLSASTLPFASANYVLSRQNQGANDATDSDPDRATGITATVHVNANQYDQTTDAGLLLRGSSLGDRVWIDLNNNGVQDAGEDGLNGVTVTLLNGTGGTDIDPITAGTQTLSTTTANNPVGGLPGYYKFSDLVPGMYIVQVTLPTGYQFSPQNAGTPNDDSADSDVSLTNGQTAVITIGEAGSDLTWDAGLVPLASISNLVWRDNNNNGIQDAGELGLNGVTVNLLDSNGVAVDNPNVAGIQNYTYTTAGGGLYLFNNLPPDVSYIVQFTTPAHFRRSPVDAGADTVDSDADLTLGRSPATLLLPDEDNISVDAGFVPLASIGDLVWTDTDGDGVKDAGETGRNGITVRLYATSNLTTALSTTITAANPVGGAAGYYQFTDLDAGDYVIEIAKPNGFIITRQDINSVSTTPSSSDTNDSDVDRFTAKTGSYTLYWGDSNPTVDMGVLQPATLGDLVWLDADDDGVKDLAETGINGVMVRLLDNTGTAVNNPNNATPAAYVTTTSAAGAYSFTGLFPGSYIVEFVLPDANTVFARQNQGADDTVDSDVNRLTGRTGTYTLTANQTNSTADAGMMTRASLGNLLWNDVDGDGVQDAGESGMDGVTVTLLNGTGGTDIDAIIAGTQTLSTTTAGGGAYSFTNLVPGAYIVQVTLPAGYIFTRQDVIAATDATDSDADRFTGRTIATTLISGENDLTWDAGVLQPATLGDLVWLDADDDGVKDTTETGINGVTARLLDSTGTAVNNPNNATPTAYVTPTDTNGAYSFTGLFPGSYIVEFVLPGATYAFSRQDINSAATNPASDDSNDSDAIRTTGRTGTYTLIANQTDNSADAGMMLRASVGDKVWNDVDGDGVQDGGETGMNGVTVTLLNGAGGTDIDAITAGTQNLSTTTNATGIYSFTNLVPGDYLVAFTLPAGYIFTQQDAAAATDATDSDVVRLGATQGHTISTTLIPGENDTTWDAGVLQSATLGDLVWLDSDDDGVKDTGETGINGVTVRLLDSTGTAVNDPNNATPTAYVTPTDTNGAYSFTGLFPGSYIVEFVLPDANTVFARPNQGADDTMDSDADRLTGRTGTYTLIANQTNSTADAGMMTRASLGNLVWDDVNGNGVQDGGESGVDGVQVTLLNGTGGTDIDAITAGTQTLSTTTAGGGAYSFTNLVPGGYLVAFTLPSGYVFTVVDSAAGTDATDSDANRFTKRTIATTLISGENDTTWDAGVVKPATLGNFVWLDSNDDGTQDAGEPGISGVTVRLLDSAGTAVNDPNNATPTAYVTTTAANGAYSFTGLIPGDYRVEYVLPGATYAFAEMDVVAATDAADSDADRVTGRTATYTLAADQTDNSADAGMVRRASLGDRVWNDVDGDGSQDAGETGVNGVTVTLLNGAGGTDIDAITAGTQILSTITAAGGAYSFTNLVPGTYIVQVTLPTGYIFTRQDTSADTADSDVDRLTGLTGTYRLLSNQTDTSADAGILQNASLGNLMWDDLDGDGAQDAGETGIRGVTVTLYDGTGTQADNPNTAIADTYVVTTGAGGDYLFDHLLPGDYYIVFTLPTGYMFTAQDAATDATDSDVVRLGATQGKTITTSLISGEDDATWDAGVLKPATLGNFVWTDSNDNGLQDVGETGVDGVTVRLLNGSGTAVNDPKLETPTAYEVTTASGGAYSFTGLFPGNYIVEFVLPDANTVFARLNQGADTAVDSDANRVTGRTVVYTLTADQTDDSADAGLLQRASLGNFVWNDADGNGVQDGGETGVDGVQVTLLNGAGGTDIDAITAGTQTLSTTTAGGAYSFTKLVPGTYIVQVTLPASYIFTRQDATTDTDDSDVDRFTGRTIVTTLISGENDTTWDTGVLKLATLGDLVWLDNDDDGLQDAGEPGVSGMTVNLLDGAGNPVNDPNSATPTAYSVTTDANGHYAFTGLFPGNYIAEFVLINANYTFARQNQGADTAVDSDADRTTGRTGVVTLVADQTDTSADSGVLARASLGNRVWDDVDGDGVQDAGESGLGGVTVTLYNSADVQVGLPKATDGTGAYLFDNLVPGDYYVVFTLPAGYMFTVKDAATATDLTDSDAVRLGATQGRTLLTTLISGEADDSWDAGVLKPATLGNFVWADSDDDGVQDAGETGVNGVTVRLLDSSGAAVNDPAQITPTAYEVTTVSGGAYSFSGLFPGNYIVEFVLPDANTVFARLNQGADTAVDSDADRLTGHTGVYTLTADQTDNSADVGLLQRASLGNFVWNDADGNGTQNGGETGVDGVQVTLLNGAGGTDIDAITAGTQTLSTTTAAGGAYIFTNLVPGAYIVQVTLPAGYIFTRQDAATDTTDSDVDRFTGSTIATTLISGENDTTWDTGVLKPAALGNFVWLDSDDDGLQDAGEAAVSGIAVHLLDSTGAAVDDPNKAAPTAYSVTTDANGAYSFTGLFPGSYRVEFVLPDANTVFARLNQGADTAADSDADRTTGRTGVYTLVADQTDNSADAGLMTLASIGNFVWLDLNDNGLQDGGEPGLKDVTIFLTDENAVTTSTTSATDGSYSFTNLVPGNYSLQFVLPSNQYEFSDTDQGANDALDSDADTVTGNTATTHLISDETDRTWDAGIVLLASIGDRVWLDADNDGIQDAGEADFANVTVNLLNASGTVLQTTQTDANGNYLFDLLTPADYAIEVLLPDVIYQFSPQDQGAVNGSDSDVNIVSGRTVVTTLSPDEHDLSWDAGLVLLSSVGNYVWVDMNNDGVQDGGETGLTGVTVRLLDAGGATVATTTTGANGDYLFDLVSPDDYRVEFVLPLHYQFSLPDMGGNDATDSDANRTTGRTVLFTLPPDTKEATRDAGLVPLSSIGNHVWRDNDGNGLQDGGETGLVGVTMHLLDGTVILTTTTDTNGDYLFSDLPPGDYAIEVVTPDNFMIAPQNQSADTTVDSDVDPTTGRSAYTTLLPDEADLSWDVGLPPLGSIGDLVWADVDGDGMQDAGEPGLAGISLELLANDIPYAQTTTDADGHYLFDNLPPGDYRLVVIPPASYAVSPSNASLETTDSDLDEITDSTPVIPMDYGLIDLGWDVGLVPLGSIGDLVWDDANGNSVLDGGESGIPNVTLTLTLPDTTTLTTQTDRNGKYAFPNLLTGKYTVTVDVGTLPAGMEATYDLAPPFDSSAEYMLGIGEQADVLDFGYQTPSPIGIQGGTSTEASTTPPPQEGSAPPGNTGCVSACVDWQLYHSNQTGDWEIFRLDADGTSTNLSQGGAADDMAPTRSPDAQWIVFSSNRDGNWELYLAAADGDDSSSNRLTYNTIANDTDPVWGPNSSVVYETTRDGNWELYLLDMATGAERRLTDDPATDINAYWSEDGTKIVFQSDRSGLWQLYELDLTTNQTTLLSDGVANDVDAQYSSDDQRILFRSYRDGAKSTLYIMNADGSGLIRISDVRGDATNPSGSSDDRLIAYQSALDGDLDIYVYEVGTGITRKLTDNAVADYAPTWLCDSSTVIFTSDVDGNPNLFDADALSINAPLDVPTEAQRLTTAPEADIYPENAHREENASREGQLPGVNLGDQTNFLLPDVSVTVVDPSVDTGEAWEPLAVCPVQPQ
jgi:Tol biopolymer transport system component